MSKKTAFVDLINDNRIIMPACLRMAATNPVPRSLLG